MFPLRLTLSYRSGRLSIRSWGKAMRSKGRSVRVEFISWGF